jgi:predicted amidohydrolase YtcJ
MLLQALTRCSPSNYLYLLTVLVHLRSGQTSQRLDFAIPVDHGRLTVMTISLRFLILSLLLATGCSRQSAPLEGEAAAELILANARVYTLDWPDPLPEGLPSVGAPYENGWFPDASAVAIRDGEIVFVGSDADAQAWRGDATEWRDLDGATVVPGLVDAHTHVFQLGLSLNRVNLYDVETEEEAIARVVERAASVPKGEWIIGQGWDEGRWADRYPDKRRLSEAVPDHPVFMRSLHSFAGWCNQMALDRAGVNRDTPVPEGGEMRLDAAGDPNGLFLNRAVPLVEDAIPAMNDDQLRANVLAGLQRMAADGYVTVHDAGLHSAEMRVLEQLEREGKLPIRVYAMVSVRDEALAREWLQRGPDTDADSMLVTRSIKAFYDGALGSRGARLLDDYSDRPGLRGVSGNEYGFDAELTAEMMHAGFQVGIHAIGDAGNRETLNFIGAVRADSAAARSGRHRIEHAQVLHPVDFPLMGEYQVIASMQPPHAVEDKAWAEQRLGPERILSAYAWRSMRKNGAMVVFSADNPGSDHSIFYGLHAAVTRRDKQTQPVEGWHRQEAFNIDEAMRAYTRWSAYAGFREKETGFIEVGRWADLTVMDIDPFVLSLANPAAILEGQVEMTLVGGNIVYQR